jgi:DNA-binding NtrC family response regulator
MNVVFEYHEIQKIKRIGTMKILIIDDDVAIASALKELFELEGYQVSTGRDGNDGYLAYLACKPDLVITDIQMPGKDGFELMKDIRVHHPKMKTIYMSGSIAQFQPLLEEEKNRYQVDFLTKPFAINELISLVSKNLGTEVISQ